MCLACRAGEVNITVAMSHCIPNAPVAFFDNIRICNVIFPTAVGELVGKFVFGHQTLNHKQVSLGFPRHRGVNRPR